jgi:hypothetical protein
MSSVTVTIHDAKSAARHFIACCLGGDLAGAQAIARVSDVGPRAPYALRRACAAGHLPVAQWLTVHFGVSAEEARQCGDYALHRACRNGHWEVAAWLVREFELPLGAALAVKDKLLAFAGWAGPDWAAALRALFATEYEYDVADVCGGAAPGRPWVDASALACVDPAFRAPSAEGLRAVAAGRRVQVSDCPKVYWVRVTSVAPAADPRRAVFQGVVAEVAGLSGLMGFAGLTLPPLSSGAPVTFEGRHVLAI